MNSAAEAIEAIQTLRIYQYTTVATLSLLSYEHLIKLDEEVRYLWRRRLRFGGMLLFLCRYLPFSFASKMYFNVTTADVNPSHCLAVLRMNACLNYVQGALAILVLFTRAYAVWGGARNIAVPLALIFAGVIVGTCYPVYLYIRGVRPIGLHVAHGCIIQIGNEDVWITFTIILFSEIVTLGVLLAKSIMHTRDLKRLQCNFPRQSILTVMARDGIGYFFCAVAITTANLVVLRSATPNLRAFLYGTQGILQNILCSRLLLHIHAVIEYPDDGPSIWIGSLGDTISAIEIAPRERSTGTASGQADTVNVA